MRSCSRGWLGVGRHIGRDLLTTIVVVDDGRDIRLCAIGSRHKFRIVIIEGTLIITHLIDRPELSRGAPKWGQWSRPGQLSVWRDCKRAKLSLRDRLDPRVGVQSLPHGKKAVNVALRDVSSLMQLRTFTHLRHLRVMHEKNRIEASKVGVGHVSIPAHVGMDTVVNALERIVARCVTVLNTISSHRGEVFAGGKQVVHCLTIRSEVGIQSCGSLTILASRLGGLGCRVSIGVLPLIPDSTLTKDTSPRWIESLILIKRVGNFLLALRRVDVDGCLCEQGRKHFAAGWWQSPVPSRPALAPSAGSSGRDSRDCIPYSEQHWRNGSGQHPGTS